MVVAKVSLLAKASPWMARAKQRSMNSFWAIFDWCINKALWTLRSSLQHRTSPDWKVKFVSFHLVLIVLKWTLSGHRWNFLNEFCRRRISCWVKLIRLRGLHSTPHLKLVLLCYLIPTEKTTKKPVLTRTRSILLLNDSSEGALPLSRRRCALTHKGLYSVMALESDFWWAKQPPFASMLMKFA